MIKGAGNRLSDVKPEAKQKFEDFKKNVPKEATYKVEVN